MRMIVQWVRWAIGIDDDSSVRDYLRERGKIVAEDLDLNPPKDIEDIDRDWPV